MTAAIFRPVIWTDEECKKLNEYQNGDFSHPFTCGNDRMDAAHRKYQAEHGGDFGQLVATPQGWICPSCSWHQDFAHGFMFKGAMPNPFEQFQTKKEEE